MKLIIGLGNPGKEYENTRHNVGFAVVNAIARKEDAEFLFEKKFNAEIAKTRFDYRFSKTSSRGEPVILVKPHTFVNKSGEAVKKIKLSCKMKPADIIIAHDDLDIEFGNFKISFGKDSGGHRGVQSVIDALKTNKFWRLRMGTANRKLVAARHQRTLKAKKESVGDFVLSRFTPTEQVELKKIIKKALEELR